MARSPSRRRRGTPRSKAFPIAHVADNANFAKLLAEKEAQGWPRPKSITAFFGKQIIRWRLTFSRSVEGGRESEIYTWRVPRAGSAKG